MNLLVLVFILNVFASAVRAVQERNGPFRVKKQVLYIRPQSRGTPLRKYEGNAGSIRYPLGFDIDKFKNAQKNSRPPQEPVKEKSLVKRSFPFKEFEGNREADNWYRRSSSQWRRLARQPHQKKHHSRNKWPTHRRRKFPDDESWFTRSADSYPDEDNWFPKSYKHNSKKMPEAFRRSYGERSLEDDTSSAQSTERRHHMQRWFISRGDTNAEKETPDKKKKAELVAMKISWTNLLNHKRKSLRLVKIKTKGLSAKDLLGSTKCLKQQECEEGVPQNRTEPVPIVAPNPPFVETEAELSQSTAAPEEEDKSRKEYRPVYPQPTPPKKEPPKWIEVPDDEGGVD